MNDKKLLIVGIDPGTTTAYAVLDLEGNLISTKSSKNFGLNYLLSEVTKIGKVVIVGTDKAKVPNLVYKFSTKTGSKIIYPYEDLKINEKRNLTKEFKTYNEHQNDALASSLFALNKIKNIFLRINEYIEVNNKFNIKNKIIDLVLTKDLSLRESVDLIENSNKEETKIIKRVVEKKELKQKDFMKLYRMVKRYEKENYSVKMQNYNLKKGLKTIERNFRFLNYKLNNINVAEKTDKRIKLKEKSINFLESEIKNKDGIIESSVKKIRIFNNYLSKWNEIFILKKLDNLGSSEFSKKKDLLNIAKNDILLVNNPNITSKNIINYLKNKVRIIITKIPASSKIIEDFLFIDEKRLKIEEDEFFAVAKRGDIDKIVNNKESLHFIVENYKKNRKVDTGIT